MNTHALLGDRDAFEAAVAPHLDDLHAAAAHLLSLHQAADGSGGTDLTPEELVGETLLRAFDRRARFATTGMTLRAWLLGLQTRALAIFERQEHDYTDRKALSLDEPVPTGDETDAVEEERYEFRQPFDVLRYQDVIPGTAPMDLDIGPATPFDERSLGILAALDLPDEARHAVLLHDEYDLSIAEVAQILRASVQDAAGHLDAARASLREKLGPS
jgi:RNA polymerase sigma-70 factor (ECF subfamily)